MDKNWRPPLSGADPLTDQAMRIVFDYLYALRAQTQTAKSEIASTRASIPTLTQIQSALQLGGTNSLNVTGLPGVLADPQSSVVSDTYTNWVKYPAVEYTGSIYVITDKGQPGGILYYSNGSHWVYLIGTDPVFSQFGILYANKLSTAQALTPGSRGLYVAITDKNNVQYYHNGVSLAYLSGAQPILYADIAALIPTLDPVGEPISDDNLQISITDRNNIIYSWDTTTAKFTYLSGVYPRTFAQMGVLAATLGMDDTGLLVRVTDRGNVVYRWTGVKFVYNSAGPYVLTYADSLLLAPTLGVDDTNLPVQLTDWNNNIYTWDGADFIWTSGEIITFTWAEFAAITFTANDEGVRVYISTYHHYLIYGPAGWQWDVDHDDLAAGMGPVMFEIAPGTGWVEYDGSTVSYVKSDGTLGSVTLPDLITSPSYLKAGGAASGPNAASGSTANESSHQHELPFDMHGQDHNEVHWAADNIFGSGSAMTEVVRSTTTPEAGAGNYALSGAGSAHSHAVGTVEPQNLVRKAYFRQ